MTIRLGVVMDPIKNIKVHKDTTLAILLAAQQEGFELYYMEPRDLFVQAGVAWGKMCGLEVFDSEASWFELTICEPKKLSELDIVLMRKDPPFTLDYIYLTYILELAEKQGVCVVNKPQGLRNVNEKFYTSHFPQCIAPTLISCNRKLLKDFIAEQKSVVLKPLNGMGGHMVFHLHYNDININVVLETMTQHYSRFIIAQRFIPEIAEGDKRVILINGEPVDYALARIPQPGERRANLAVGGKGVGVKLTKRDRWICQQVGPTLRDMGLWFVGLDIIGEYLTEINVTSPTCVREIEAHFKVNICEQVLDAIKSLLI